jgi:hypothetical protein
MALVLNAYKNARAAVGTTYATVYTCPASTTALVVLAQAANVDGAASADVSVQWLDNSAADVATRVVETLAVAADSSVNLLAGPITLEAGDAIQAKASATGDIELTLSVAEMVAG